MPRNDYLPGITMKHPDDYRECTVHGVHLKRTTPMTAPSHYLAKHLETGTQFEVVGGGSNRLPWKIRQNGRHVDLAKTLPDAALVIVSRSGAVRGGNG